MKKQFILIIALLALVSMMIVPVMAVPEYTGTLSPYTDTSSTILITYNIADTPVSNGIDTMQWITDINNIGTPQSLLYYSPTDQKISGSGSFTINVTGGQTYATGTVNFQNGTNMYGSNKQYWYYTFQTWNVSGLTGEVIGTLKVSNFVGSRPSTTLLTIEGNYVKAGTPYFGYKRSGASTTPLLPSGGGIYQQVPNTVTYDYQFTKISGSGSGQITSANITRVLNTIANKIVIKNESGINLYSSTTAVTTGSETFLIPGAPFKISTYVGTSFYNDTTLFYAAAVPTITPTPTTTIPAGYIATRVHLMDNGGNPIHGGNINILDVEANVWTNSTSDADGILYVYTLPYHTIDIYGSFTAFANEFLPNQLLGQETGYEGGYVYWLTLYPYETIAPPGETSLYVEVRDAQTHYIVTYSVVRIDYNGLTFSQNTGNTPSALFLVPNNTIIHATASKTGYVSGTIVTNSSSGSTKTVTIELSKSTVTPTVTRTPLPGEITARPTYAPGCDPAAYDAAVCTRGKDSDMMNQIRDAGPGLIGLAIIATAIGLIKLMSKR